MEVSFGAFPEDVLLGRSGSADRVQQEVHSVVGRHRASLLRSAQTSVLLIMALVGVVLALRSHPLGLLLAAPVLVAATYARTARLERLDWSSAVTAAQRTEGQRLIRTGAESSGPVVDAAATNYLRDWSRQCPERRIGFDLTVGGAAAAAIAALIGSPWWWLVAGCLALTAILSALRDQRLAAASRRIEHPADG